MRFGLPLVLTYALAFTVHVRPFHNRALPWCGEVGIYAAGFSLIDRITQILFMMIATPPSR